MLCLKGLWLRCFLRCRIEMRCRVEVTGDATRALQYSIFVGCRDDNNEYMYY